MSELRYVIDICGLEEGIRCAICENPMHTDNGCDGGCKYNEKAFKRITDLLDKRIELLPIAPEPHWIPVTENCDCDLMDNEEVLVFQNDGTINGQIRHAMFYDFNGKKKFVTWEEGITIYNVVAYMPLPEPYKGVTE